MSDLNLFLAESNENFKIVVVTFPTSSKQYHYKTVIDVVVGDKVVVDAPSGMQVVEVEDVIPAIETELSFNYQLKWLVCKVDMEHYEQCKTMEREATKKLNQLKYSRKRKEIMSHMEEHLGKDGVDCIKKLVRL